MDYINSVINYLEEPVSKKEADRYLGRGSGLEKVNTFPIPIKYF